MIYGIIALVYGLLGFRSLFYFLLIAVPVEFLIIRPLIKKNIITIISIQELDYLYKATPRWKRIIFFILAILIVVFSVILFLLILFSARFFK